MAATGDVPADIANCRSPETIAFYKVVKDGANGLFWSFVGELRNIRQRHTLLGNYDSVAKCFLLLYLHELTGDSADPHLNEYRAKYERLSDMAHADKTLADKLG